jgi:hypothetical protein
MNGTNTRRGGARRLPPEHKSRGRGITFSDAQWEVVKAEAARRGVSASRFAKEVVLAAVGWEDPVTVRRAMPRRQARNPGGRRRDEDLAARNARIRDLKAGGYSLREISEEVELTPQRISQILREGK